MTQRCVCVHLSVLDFAPLPPPPPRPHTLFSFFLFLFLFLLLSTYFLRCAHETAQRQSKIMMTVMLMITVMIILIIIITVVVVVDVVVIIIPAPPHHPHPTPNNPHPPPFISSPAASYLRECHCLQSTQPVHTSKGAPFVHRMPATTNTPLQLTTIAKFTEMPDPRPHFTPPDPRPHSTPPAFRIKPAFRGSLQGWKKQ